MKKIVLAMLLAAAVTAVAQTTPAPAQPQPSPSQPAPSTQQTPSQPATGRATETGAASNRRASVTVTTRSGSAAEKRDQRPGGVQRLYRRAWTERCRSQNQRL